MHKQTPTPRHALDPAAVKALAAFVDGPVFVPGDEGYDEERSGFELTVTHHPAVIVGVTRAADVTGVDLTRDAYAPEDYERLRQRKARWDPRNMFCLNPNIPPANS